MEHLIGKGIDRAIRLAYGRRLESWGPELAPFDMEGHLARFTHLAGVVSGKDLRVVELRGDPQPRPYGPVLRKMAHPAILPGCGFGWTDGETLYLPERLVDMADPRAQEDLAKLLLFFLAGQAGGGAIEAASRNRGPLQEDTLVADLFWIIENSRLARELSREYPGLFRAWPSVKARLLERRPPARLLHPLERKAEQFLRQAVEGKLPVAGEVYGPEESLDAARKAASLWRDKRRAKYRAMVPFAPWGRLVPGRLGAEAACSTGPAEAARPGERNTRPEDPEKRSRYLASRREVDEEANDQGLALNIYDKLISWAEFVNVQRPFDDDPEEAPGSKADQMEELTTAEVKRSTNAFFDADIETPLAEAPEAAEDLAGEELAYPEWDYRKGAYRQGYSTLVEQRAVHTDGEFASKVLRERRGAVKEVKRKFEALTPATRVEKRQYDGELIDLDAAVEAAADLEAGIHPSERLYARNTREERDLSVLFLVDLSMSTDAWVKDRKVIDHEKEALIVLSEAMDKTGDRYSLAGFSGRTRKACSYYRIKDFSEPYGPGVRERIGGLIPLHYTRMGPAIRHSVELLKREPSRSKLLFILSDGKPNDMDVYEGRYGVEDTRRAVKEAERDGVVPICITIDRKAGEYLPRVFGPGNFLVISDVERLASRLPDLYARLVHSL